MGRYSYNATLVSDALEELNNALKSIEDVNVEIQKGLDIINNARGAKYIDMSGATNLLQYQDLAETVISDDIKTIKQKCEAIEDYENAGFFTKLFASAGMALTKFGEGVGSAIEDLGDGVVSIVGAVGGIFNSDFKDACAEYVKKDHIGDAFAEAYENGILKNVNKYSWMSHESTAANIFKGIGYAAPYVALSMTGVGLAAETTIAAVGGIGSGTSIGLQQGKDFNSAFASGLWEGTKNAALVYGMGKLAKGIQANAATKTGKILTGSADDFANLASQNLDDVAKGAKNIFGTTDDIVAQNINGRIQLNSATTGQVIGDVVVDGNKAVIRNFTSSGMTETTKVISKSGKTLILDGLQNTDDLMKSSFSKLVKTNTPSTSEKVFQKAGNLEKTEAGKVITTVDDAITGSKVGKAVKYVANKGTGAVKTIVSKSPKVVQKLANGAVKLVKNHKVGAFTTAAAVFTADKVADAESETAYRISQTPNVVNPTTVDPVEPEPTVIDTGTPTPDPTDTGGTTTPDNPTPDPTDTGGTTTTPDYPTPNPIDTGSGETETPDNPTPDSNNATGEETIDQASNSTDTGNESNSANNTNNNQNDNYSGDSNSNGIYNTGHDYSGYPSSSGGGYSADGYTSEETPTEPLVDTSTVLGETENVSNSFSDLVNGNSYTKIPTSSSPITSTTTRGSKNSAIPLIAGLGAAAVAGLGTKAYLDKKENSDNEETDDVTAEEWSGEDTFEVEYEESDGSDYLSPTDEYSYQEEPQENYEAVNSSELASMQ